MGIDTFSHVSADPLIPDPALSLQHKYRRSGGLI